ncbi:MAG: bifunctional sulfate adenylyltransferase/adenylylsulfate kinase [bacterium]|nr:bifunctional sulfate adenylyltransferase/adenylylsulfate kinase [bacterium]
MTGLISPYGNTLINLVIPQDQLAEKLAHAKTLPVVNLSMRAICDLELLATGAFSPLAGFMNQADFESVVHTMRLANGTLFPMPIVLPVPDNGALSLDTEVALADERNNLLAILRLDELYAWDYTATAQEVFGTLDTRHPIVAEMTRWHKLFASGKLEVLSLPKHYDFLPLRRTPAEVREALTSFGKSNVVAFQTRNPLHRAHEELTKRAARSIDGTLLLHPVVGMTKPGDVDHFTRVRTYKALVENHYQPHEVLLSLLNLAMRMGGPREAVWHAIIRRNHGANHFIVGRDHAGPGNDSNGKPFYGPYDAQELVAQFADEIGVKMIPFKELVYLADENRYEEDDKVPAGATVKKISGTQVREDYLGKGIPLPAWFTHKEVAEVLAESYPPLHRQGFVIWFTGLSGSGKSTTAEILSALLLEHGRQATMLDGDIVRQHLTKGLGFSPEDRDTNIRRIGFVGSEICRHGGAVICAAISPYRATRDEVRAMVGENFIEVFVDTPIEVCEERDIKGMYAKARRGEIKDFTGVDAPYEAPLKPEVTLTTVEHTPEQNAHKLIAYLRSRGFVHA